MFARLYLLVLCAALLLPQAGAAHAHLCLDGAGPAVTMHMSEAAGTCTHVDAGDHHDHAIDVDSPAVGKASPPGLDGDLFVFVPGTLLLQRQVRFVPVEPDIISPAAPLHLRPLLRGPPA